MKTIVKKHLTPDQYAVGPLIHWSSDIKQTLKLLWSNIELTTPRFYQSSFKFDRPVAIHGDYIREFFHERGVFAAVRDYDDPHVGQRSWLVLIALSERYSKYTRTYY